MKILNTRDVSIEEILKRIQAERSRKDSGDTVDRTREIMEKVKEFGDKALIDFVKTFDGAAISSVCVSPSEIDEARRGIDKKLFKALEEAKKNIEKFHKKTLTKKEKAVETEKGVFVWREFRPVERVGLYVPGGKAAYPSTVLMLSIPAKIAGCKEIVLCTPAGKDGQCSSVVLAAASLCGITKIYKVGGAAAIAAMAYGTKSIPKVSKIFGPGNSYVTTAKMLAFGDINIDMPAGPSEVLVMADESATASWVAADLLSQLEHGEDSQAVFVTFSEAIAEKVMNEMKRQMQSFSRINLVKKSFEKSFAVVVKTAEEACILMNEYAPEHLELSVKNPEKFLKKINNAGSIFVGHYTNEPLGDYATGANHTLPTAGYAKMFGALSTESFGKMIQIQKVTREGIRRLRSTVTTLAESEGLEAHKNAVEIRFLRTNGRMN